MIDLGCIWSYTRGRDVNVSHIPNSLRFRERMWCQTHSCIFFLSILMIKLNVGPPKIKTLWWSILSFLYIVFLCHLFNFFILKFSFKWHSLSCEFFHSISIISNPFTFGLCLQVTLKNCKCIMLSWYIFIRHLKLRYVFLNWI